MAGGANRKPDSFYAEVAKAYRLLNAEGRWPAPVLAARNGVPVTTIHGWVKEARRRRLLPPSRGSSPALNDCPTCGATPGHQRRKVGLV